MKCACLSPETAHRVGEAVQSLLLAHRGKRNRRGRLRNAYYCPASVTLADEPLPHVSVCTRDLSASGIGLLHVLPLERGEVIVTCRPPMQAPVAFRCRIRWCRSFAHWYASGGQLLDVVETKQEDAAARAGRPAAEPERRSGEQSVFSRRQRRRLGETSEASCGAGPASSRLPPNVRVARAVKQLLSDRCSCERRAPAREPFFCPVTVAQRGRMWSGFVRDVSPLGVGLLHTVQPECGDAVVSLWSSPLKAASFRAEFLWWQGSAEGWCLSAARFLDVCEPLPESPWSDTVCGTFTFPSDKTSRRSDRCRRLVPIP